MACKFETQADDYVKQATKIMEKTNWFSNIWSIFGGETEPEKVELAIELYTKAIPFYKAGNYYKKAGDVHSVLAKLYTTKSHNQSQVISNFISAGEMYKHVDMEKAKEFFNLAVNESLKEGKFNEAANGLKNLGEIAEEGACFTEAIKLYEDASKYFELTIYPSKGMICLEKAAYLSIGNNEYEKAITNLEKLATLNSTRLTDFKCKQYFFEIIIIVLFLGDAVRCKELLKKYCKIKSNFEASIEYDTLVRLVDACQYPNGERFAKAIPTCRITMKPWTVDLLETIQTKLDKNITKQNIIVNNNGIEEDDLT